MSPYAGLCSYVWFQGTALIPTLNVIVKIPVRWTTVSNAIPVTLYVTVCTSSFSHVLGFLAFIFPSTPIRVSANRPFNGDFMKSKIHNTWLSLVHYET